MPDKTNSRIHSSLSSHSDPSSPWLLSPTLLRPCSPIFNQQTLPFNHNPHSPSQLSTAVTISTTPTKRRRVPQPPKRQLSTPTLSSTNSTSQNFNLAPCHICHRRPTALTDLPGYSSCESCERRTCYICMRVCEGEGCRSSTSTDITMASFDSDQPQPKVQSLQRPRGFRNHPSNFYIGHNNNPTNGSAESAIKGKSICGKCCREVGADGRVWCLVCFEDDDDFDRDGGGDSGDEEGDGTGRVEQWLERCDGLA